MHFQPGEAIDSFYTISKMLARHSSYRRGATLTVVGTFGYMPPEQFSGQAVPASDLYALGVTLLHLATGIEPTEFPRQGLQFVISEHLSLDPGWRAWVKRMVEPEPARRFPGARSALEWFEQRSNLLATKNVQRKITKTSPALGFIEVMTAGCFFSLTGMFCFLMASIAGFQVIVTTQSPVLAGVAFLTLLFGPVGFIYKRAKKDELF